MQKLVAWLLLCSNDHGCLLMKRKVVLIEDWWVHMSHYYEEEAEEDDITPPFLCPIPNPHLDNHYLHPSLFIPPPQQLLLPLL